MGVGNLQIGIGQGAAQEFGHNPAIQQFGEMLAQRKAKEDKENDFINDELTKSYDPNSLRNDSDKSEYINRYNNDIKKAAIEAENERDPKKRALNIAEVRQKINDLSGWAEKSKQQGVFERQMLAKHLENRYLLDDNSVKKLKDQMSKRWDDSDVIRDAGGFERGINPDEITKKYEKLKKDNIEPTQWGPYVKTDTLDFDGKKKAIFQQHRGVPIDGDNGAYHRFLNSVTSDYDWQKYLHDTYPEINTGNPQQDLAFRARKYMHDQGDVQGWFDKPKETPMEGETPQKYTLAQKWNLQHYGTPNAPTTAASSSPTYEQDLSGRLANPAKREEAIGELNTAATSNPAFSHNIYYHVNDDRTIDIDLPPKYKFDKKAQAEYDKNIGTEKADGSIQNANPNAGRLKIQEAVHYKLDPNKPEEFDQKVKEMYNYLDDKGAAAKALTFAGKGHVIGSKGGLSQQSKTGQSKSEKIVGSSDVDKLANKWGMSKDKAIEYLKEQGYTIK